MKKSKPTATVGDLFQDILPPTPSKEQNIRVDIDLLQYPICLLNKKEACYSYSIEIADGHSWQLIGNPEMGLHIPTISELDYLYGLFSILFEQTNLMSNTIYFLSSEHLKRSGKEKTTEEYKRQYDAIQRYRHLTIKSNILRRQTGLGDDKVEEQSINILQHTRIIGGSLQRGRKKLDDSREGFWEVTFSDYVMASLRDKQLSAPLNFSWLMSLPSTKTRRLFGLIEVWRLKDIGAKQEGVVERPLSEVQSLMTIKSSKPAEVRRILDPCHNELVNAKYMESYSYAQRADTIYVQYHFSEYSIDQRVMWSELVKRGVYASAAKQFVTTIAPQDLADILKYCDIQKSRKDINGLYIVRVIENRDMDQIRNHNNKYFASMAGQPSRNQMRERKLTSLYNAHLEQLQDDYIASLADDDRESLRREAIKSIGPIESGLLSEKILAETIEGVMVTLTKERISLPTYEEWLEKSGERK